MTDTINVEALCEQIAQFLHDEGGFDDAWSNHTWPEHPDDTGQRDGGFVKIVPKDVQAKFREVAGRLVRGFKLADKDTLIRQQQAEITKLREALSQCGPVLSPYAREHFPDAPLDYFLELNDNVTKARLVLPQEPDHD